MSESDMTAKEAVEATSEAIKQHGLAVVLMCVLFGCLLYFTNAQWRANESQNREWREIQQRDITQLRDEVQTERNFIREKLIETIDKNSEALRGLQDELRSKRTP